MFLLNSFYIANIFHDFFPKFNDLFFDSRANGVFLTRLIRHNFVISCKSFTIIDRFYLVYFCWISPTVLFCFWNIRNFANGYRNFRSSSSSNKTFKVNLVYLEGLILVVPFYLYLCKLSFARHRSHLKETPLMIS